MASNKGHPKNTGPPKIRGPNHDSFEENPAPSARSPDFVGYDEDRELVPRLHLTGRHSKSAIIARLPVRSQGGTKS